LNLKCDLLVTKFALKFNLYRYNEGTGLPTLPMSIVSAEIHFKIVGDDYGASVTTVFLDQDGVTEVNAMDALVIGESRAELILGDGTVGSLRAEMALPEMVLPCVGGVSNISGTMFVDLFVIQLNAEFEGAGMWCGDIKPDDSVRFSATAKGLALQLYSDTVGLYKLNAVG
jgi:hypothetical protein